MQDETMTLWRPAKLALIEACAIAPFPAMLRRRFAFLPERQLQMDPPPDVEAEFFAALSAGDIARASRSLADNVLFLFPGLPPVHGKAAVARHLRHLRARFTEIGWTPAASLEAAPDWRITTWTVAGTRHRGGAVRAEVASVMRLDRDGRIAYLSDYFKSRDKLHDNSSNLGRTTAAPSLDAERRLGSF